MGADALADMTRIWVSEVHHPGDETRRVFVPPPQANSADCTQVCTAAASSTAKRASNSLPPNHWHDFPECCRLSQDLCISCVLTSFTYSESDIAEWPHCP